MLPRPLVADLAEQRDQLRNELEAIDQHVRELMVEANLKKRMVQAIEELIGLEAASIDLRGVPLAQQARLVSLPPQSDAGGSAIADEAHHLLKERGEPLHYTALTRALLEAGVLISGQNPSNTVIAHLTRDARFFRPSRGTYYLKELATGPVTSVGVRHKRGA